MFDLFCRSFVECLSNFRSSVLQTLSILFFLDALSRKKLVYVLRHFRVVLSLASQPIFSLSEIELLAKYIYTIFFHRYRNVHVVSRYLFFLT